MVRAHGHLKNEEATAGAWEAGRGAVIGASKVSITTGDYMFREESSND